MFFSSLESTYEETNNGEKEATREEIAKELYESIYRRDKKGKIYGENELGFKEIEGIIVANDDVVKNEVQVATLKMACPSSAKCSVLTVEDAISVLNDPRAQSLKIFIVVNNPTDARRIAEAVKDVPKVNISNYGHLGNDLNSRTKITDTVYITEQDFEEFARIRNTGKPCQYQVVPDNQPLDMYELIKKAKNK